MAEFTSGPDTGGSAAMRPGVRPFVGGTARGDLTAPRPVLVRRTPLGGSRPPYSAPTLSPLDPRELSLASLAPPAPPAPPVTATASEGPDAPAAPEGRADAPSEPSTPPSALDVRQLREQVVALDGPDAIRVPEAATGGDLLAELFAAGESVDGDEEEISWGEPMAEAEPGASASPPEFFGMTGSWPAIETDEEADAESWDEEFAGTSTREESLHRQLEDSGEESFGDTFEASFTEEVDAPYDPDVYYGTADDVIPARSRRSWSGEQAAVTPAPAPRAYVDGSDGLDTEPGEVEPFMTQGGPSAAPGADQGVADRNAMAEILVAIADRVRRGEIVVASDPGVSPQLVLARVLASLLATSS